MPQSKRVMLGVSEEVYSQLIEASECLGYPKNQETPIKYTAEFLITYALSNIKELSDEAIRKAREDYQGLT